MHMRVSGELLVPGMQDAEEADLCAEVSGIASDFEEGFRTGAEQEIIDDLFVLQHHRRQATRQGEEHMEIAPREKLLLTRGDPAVPSGGLTLRAVATGPNAVTAQVDFYFSDYATNRELSTDLVL